MRRWAWLLVLGVTLAVWAPTLTYAWVATWDDAVFILANPHVREWSWPWMLTTQWYGHWMPLTWMSFCLNYALFGFQASAWHAVNVGLHLISTVLLYRIARRLVGSEWGAIVAALVWAVHPLRMESVAWISERKDVLLGVFFLGAALLWMQERRGWALAVFVAACAAKSPAVILPVMLLAYEWWRHRPCCGGVPRVVLRRLAPFVAVSVVVSGMAFWSLHSILVSVPWSIVGLGPRLLHVAYSEVFYAMQTVWPARLSALIEYTWVPSWDQPQYPLAVGVVVVGTGFLLLTRRRWPALTAAAVAYTVAVFPQSGLFQNGPQLVANRYSYLACLSLSLLVGGAVTWGLARWPRVSLSLSAAVVAALATVTLLALPMWHDGDALWRYAALHEPTCTECLDMATGADVRDGLVPQAIARQEQAIRVSDTTPMPRWERHWNLAGLFLMDGRREDAIRELRVFLAVIPPARLAVAADADHYQRAHQALLDLEAGRL